MDNRKYKLEEALEEKHRFRSAVILTPEWDSHGNNAATWERPIKMGRFNVIWHISRSREHFASTHHNNKPKQIVIQAITRTSRSKVSTTS